VSKPSWAIRRKVIWSSIIGGFAMVGIGAIGLFNDKMTGELVIAGTSLITLVASAYVGFATVDDKWHHKDEMENHDG